MNDAFTKCELVSTFSMCRNRDLTRGLRQKRKLKFDGLLFSNDWFTYANRVGTLDKRR